MRKGVHFVFIFLIALMIVGNPFTNDYVNSLKGKSVEVVKTEDSLYEEISEKAKQYNIPASDAKIDPVWQAIPGYNGLEVDIESSYKKMKEIGRFNEEKLIYKQVPPSKHLEDLKNAVIYKGHPDKPMVSFIINVAWGNEYLSEILATLKRHHVSATFFLEGRWVQKNPELAKMIVDAGHEVGNHSYSHPNMKVISAGKIEEEISKTNEVIKATTGKEVQWFAPPSGSYRDEVVRIAANHKMGTIMWSVDTIDWQKPTPDVLVNRVLGKVHNGAIILMHPTASTAQSLDRLITEIKAKKLQINTITEMLSENRINTIRNQDFGKNSSNDIY
jgi:peptidoglycan-N-acetylglucosamine deacetylase